MTTIRDSNVTNVIEHNLLKCVEKLVDIDIMDLTPHTLEDVTILNYIMQQ